MTETMNEMGAFNSLCNVWLSNVNTADSMVPWNAIGRKSHAASSMVPKKQILKTTLPHKNSPRIKMPDPKLMILASFYLNNNFLPNEIDSNGILSMILLKLQITGVAFFLGHSVYKPQNKHIHYQYMYTPWCLSIIGISGQIARPERCRSRRGRLTEVRLYLGMPLSPTPFAS